MQAGNSALRPSGRRHHQPRVRRLLTILARPSMFGVIGLFGILVNSAALAFLTEVAHLDLALAAILASLASTLNNFVLTELLVFRGRESRHSLLVRYVVFSALNFATLFVRVPILLLLTNTFGIHYLVSNLIAIGVTFGIRYLVSDYWIWAGRDHRDELAVDGWYHYDVHGLARIRSRTNLPELAAFNVSQPVEADIVVDRRWLGGGPRLRVRTAVEGDRITYREHLGALSAAFDIVQSSPVRIEANWLLHWSHHVLYTNMVEPVLRFFLVARGHVLLHCAAVDAEQGAIVMSAQTDTGKTSTVLRLLTQRRWGFISDDMAIVTPDGSLLSYPKPMTLSSHTMSVVNEGALPFVDRAMLAIRSRVHSKSGRSAGHALGRLNIPIVTTNAWVQILIPPPKYHVLSLLECDMVERAPIDGVILMERGDPLSEKPSVDETVSQLLVNTDDAYTFPPFASISPLFRFGGLDEAALRRRERDILTSAVGSDGTVWRLRLRVAGHSWADVIPTLADEHRPAPIPQAPEAAASRAVPVSPAPV
ncbi:MAG: putative Family 2 glycosyl transferase [Chloroflexi bacterium]|nr:putative Family 2 glycosyl transferase [Chloroflexota bacterium]